MSAVTFRMERLLSERSASLAKLLWQNRVYRSRPKYALKGENYRFIIGCTLQNSGQLEGTSIYSDTLEPEKYWVDPKDNDFAMPQLIFGLNENGNLSVRVEVWDFVETTDPPYRQPKSVVEKECSPVLMLSLVRNLKTKGVIFYE